MGEEDITGLIHFIKKSEIYALNFGDWENFSNRSLRPNFLKSFILERVIFNLTTLTPESLRALRLCIILLRLIPNFLTNSASKSGCLLFIKIFSNSFCAILSPTFYNQLNPPSKCNTAYPIIIIILKI